MSVRDNRFMASGVVAGNVAVLLERNDFEDTGEAPAVAPAQIGLTRVRALSVGSRHVSSSSRSASAASAGAR